MTTIVNSPRDSADSGLGMVFGVLLAIGIIVLFLIYGLPAIRGNNGSEGINIDVNLPEGTSSTNTTN